MDIERLKNLGLRKEEIDVYLFMLPKKSVKAGEIIKKTGLKRGTVYNILVNLANKELIEEIKKTKVAQWRVKHPSGILALVEKQELNLSESKEALTKSLPALLTQYNLAHERPGVRFFEGIAGNEQLYNDILSVGQDYYLLRPVYESTFKEQVKPVFKQFMKKRISHNLRVKAITPADDKHVAPEGRKEQEKKDQDILFDRTWVSTSLYNSPVEIDIYGDRVAIMSYGKEFVGTIIQSEQISKALKQVFELARVGAKVKSFNI